MHQEPCQATTPMTNLGLLVALSIHSLLEGLAVGLEGLTSKVSKGESKIDQKPYFRRSTIILK